jgi:hypothetical protein
MNIWIYTIQNLIKWVQERNKDKMHNDNKHKFWPSNQLHLNTTSIVGGPHEQQ